MFAGRKDFQIKHMGHRIELEEIENAMNAVQDVQRSLLRLPGEEENRIAGLSIWATPNPRKCAGI